jgi:hypothetical protein
MKVEEGIKLTFILFTTLLIAGAGLAPGGLFPRS